MLQLLSSMFWLKLRKFLSRYPTFTIDKYVKRQLYWLAANGHVYEEFNNDICNESHDEDNLIHKPTTENQEREVEFRSNQFWAFLLVKSKPMCIEIVPRLGPEQLATLAESVIVASSIEDTFNEDIGEVLTRKQTSINESSHATDDRILHKDKIDVCRPTSLSNEQLKFDQHLVTPNFTSTYQFGLACPRDVIITLGDTVVEAPTATHFRYFETEYYKTLLYSIWSRSSKMKWLQPPKPTCSPTRMFYDVNYWQRNSHDKVPTSIDSNSSYKTNLNETEIAFDAADIMRAGKDIFYKKSKTANNQGIYWLRRTFPHLRFRMMHFPGNLDRHLDTSLVPLRPPTSGSPGIVLINQNRPPLVSEMKLFTDNDWRPIWGPLPATDTLPPFALCSSNRNLNLLSLNDHCVIIEECEMPLYRLLHDELGFDVITCPFRVLNEFGGGIHCVVNILSDVLKQLKQADQNLTTTYIHTSNADCCKISDSLTQVFTK
ncbi:unnamed protein product [Rotaria socialis]